MKGENLINDDYRIFVTDLKVRIRSARISAARAVNRDLILLYWDIGRAIVEKQAELGWGRAVVERLAGDLQAAFPGTKGFSAQCAGSSLTGCERFSSADSVRAPREPPCED